MSESFQSIKPRNAAGFTIAELLVAAFITIGMVVLLASIFTSMSSTASRATRRTDAFRDARAALQMMERDLTGLVAAKQTAYFALDKRWQDGNDTYSNSSSGNPNRQLFALIASRNKPAGVAANAIGDVCAVGYYCKWENNRYTLRRFFLNSVATYNRIVPQLSGGNLSYTSASVLYTPGATDDLLATHVWNLQFTPYKSDGSVDTTYPLVMNPSSSAAQMPAALEISFNAMSPSAGKTVASIAKNPSDWMDPQAANYTKLVAPNSYEFRTRLSF
jgi:type II secretory pathway pseudopilin PulG